MSDGTHSDISLKWLTFFFVCFILIWTISLIAIFTYNANAPEPKPSGGGHGGMILPQDGQYAPHVALHVVA